MRFDSYHPTIIFIYFTMAIAGTICFHHPVYLAISFFCAFCYSIVLNGKRAIVFNFCLLPLPFFYTMLYSYYNHFGITNLRTNFIGNQITLEAVIYGFMRGVTAITLLMIGSCLFTIVSSDKVVYLFGRISPKVSLFLSVILRMVPRIKTRGKQIGLARKGIGKGCAQGNPFQRIKHCAGFLSILITWTLEDLVESSVSMKNRGYSLKGRTAFSIYRFDNRDRCFVLAASTGIIMTEMAAALDQTAIQFNPQIIMNDITGVSCLFYAAYAFLLCLPMLVQLSGTVKYHHRVKENCI